MGAALGHPRPHRRVIVELLHLIALSAAAIGIVVLDAWLRRPE